MLYPKVLAKMIPELAGSCEVWHPIKSLIGNDMISQYTAAIIRQLNRELLKSIEVCVISDIYKYLWLYVSEL